MSVAVERPKASLKVMVSMPASLAVAKMRARASLTGSKAMSLRFKSAGFAASFFNQPQIGNYYATVNRLHHVIDRQAGDGAGGERFHLNTGFAFHFHQRLNINVA